MKVAEIYALLGMRVDRASFAKGDKAMHDSAKHMHGHSQSVLGMMGEMAKMAAMMAVVMGTVVQAAASFELEKGLEELQIASEGAVGSLEAVRAKMLDVSDATGVAVIDILSGTRRFVEITGDGLAASASMETFATVVKASGAEMADVAASAAAMQQNLEILPEQFEASFSVLIAGGKAGAVELRDIAGVLAELAPAAAKFSGGKGVAGLTKLGAALQLVRQGTSSSSEASTALRGLMRAIGGTGAKKLAKAGIKIFNKDDSLREFDLIVADIKAKNFRRDKLIELFGRKEAVVAFDQLVKVEGAWNDLAESTVGANDVAEDYAERQSQATARLTKTWNKFRNSLTRIFSTVIQTFAYLIEHQNEVIQLLAAMAIAFTILKLKAVDAAIASALSWLAALLPFVLLAAGVVALGLLFQDLWVALFTDGDSSLRRLYNSVKGWLKKIRDSVADTVADVSIDIVGAVNPVLGRQLRAKRDRVKKRDEDLARLNEIRDQRRAQQDMRIAKFRKNDPGNIQAVVARRRAMFAGGNEQRRDDIRAEAFIAEKRGDPGAATLVANISVIEATTPRATAIAVKQELENINRATLSAAGR